MISRQTIEMMKTAETVEIRSSLCTLEEKTVQERMVLLLMPSSRLRWPTWAERSQRGQPVLCRTGEEPDEGSLSSRLPGRLFQGSPARLACGGTGGAWRKTKIKKNRPIRGGRSLHGQKVGPKWFAPALYQIDKLEHFSCF